MISMSFESVANQLCYNTPAGSLAETSKWALADWLSVSFTAGLEILNRQPRWDCRVALGYMLPWG